MTIKKNACKKKIEKIKKLKAKERKEQKKLKHKWKEGAKNKDEAKLREKEMVKKKCKKEKY